MSYHPLRPTNVLPRMFFKGSVQKNELRIITSQLVYSPSSHLHAMVKLLQASQSVRQSVGPRISQSPVRSANRSKVAESLSHRERIASVTCYIRLTKMANVHATSVRAKALLPNLLLATTYALNKSNTKRAIVGLDYAGGIYKPVVKLCCSGSPSRYVTLDTHGWELVIDQMDVMAAFFQNSYAFYGTFGNPSRVFLPNLDLIYKSSYGAKSICFEERPVGMMVGPSQRVEPSQSNSNSNETPQPSSAAASTPSTGNINAGDVANGNGNDTQQPPSKKKRYDMPPSVTMQEPTFIGLRDVRECIITRMDYLNEISGLVNRMIDHIILYLHQKLSTEETDKVKSMFKDISIFKKFFMSNYVDIHASARKAFDSTKSLKDQTVNILLLELTAYGLPWIAKHVNELVQKS